MKFFVDTAEIDEIRELNELGMVDGVTTNPSLIRKSGRNILDVTKEICEIVSSNGCIKLTFSESAKDIFFLLSSFTFNLLFLRIFSDTTVP